MTKLPAIKPRQIVRFLEKNGFILDHTSGSHSIFYNPVSRRRAVVPSHNRDIAAGVRVRTRRVDRLHDRQVTQGWCILEFRKVQEALNDPFNLIGRGGAQDCQKSFSNFFWQSDLNFLISIFGVRCNVNRDSDHPAGFHFTVGEFPVDVDGSAFTFAQPNC
jgi:predicted RNA binding protein YcfA (HicA-like mRNA interferase family)